MYSVNSSHSDSHVRLFK